GYGTLDELFEILTWAQLRLHDKPIGLLNHAGFYDELLAFLRHASSEGFLARQHLRLLLCDDNLESLLDGLVAHRPNQQPLPDQWGREAAPADATAREPT